MAVPRRLLGLFAMVSLAILVYAGVSLSFSVPVDAESAAGFAGAPGAPSEGRRALVVPLVEAARVPTFEEPQDLATLGHPGALLVLGERMGAVPATADDTRVVRALAFVGPHRANATVTLVDVPVVENGTLVPRNLTWDAAAMSANATGFLVKTDHAENATFVPVEDVVGQVVRFEPPGRIGLLFGAGAAGFVAPLILLMLTHRGGAAKPGPALRLCRDCRAEVPDGSAFCHRCGAYVEGGATDD